MTNPVHISEIIQKMEIYKTITTMNEFEQIRSSLKKKLIDMNKTQRDVAEKMRLSPSLLSAYLSGKVQYMTPELLRKQLNEAISQML